MKIKIIFICFITTLLGEVVNAQDSFSATEFIQGTYMGTTMPLRDFPTTEYDATSPKTMTIIENKFQITDNQNNSKYFIFKNTLFKATIFSRQSNNIIDYIKYQKRIFPIGRLDKPSEGLIFLTNDGDIVNKILFFFIYSKILWR